MKRHKTAHDYGNEIMEAMDLTLDSKTPNKRWRKKHGNACLYDVTVNIVKKAMRLALKEYLRSKKNRLKSLDKLIRQAQDTDMVY